MNAKKALRVLALTLALVFMFSAVAFAATPSIIFYQNAAGQIVQVDYQKAMDQAAAGNTALLQELKRAYIDAQDNFRPIVVKNDDGSVVDWSKALKDKKPYQQVVADDNYKGTEPRPDVELVVDETGKAVEKPVAKPWPAEMEGLPLISYSDLTQKTYATITIKAEYVDKVTAVTIAGKAAVQQPDRSKWRAEVPAGTTAESLAGKIVITVQEPPAPGQWPEQMEGLPLISYSDLTQKTYATITIKAEYVDKVTAVTIAGKAAVQQPDRSKWRAEVPAGTTAESLAGKIVITVQEPPAPGPVEAIKEIRAKLDLFGQTRVWVFLNEGVEAASVTANGQALQYNAVDQRWEGVLDNLKVGDPVKVVVTTTGGSNDEGTATVVAMGS
ncbi:hypothetical protein Desku_0264 [Desulfofundulus kuznetsovii DSM 6115]|uniref:Uncharacterized protein n=1 Tax=Desulfofundulus kuznetsovii (strain DSM 6115 / VKM B-1805 / 17) TaxID=760568 RepID=A0AAU8PTE3_DESK7|nr:hypothetical protein Desku_0264 [Desulfofundulus kuznetsovii DSM 6115]